MSGDQRESRSQSIEEMVADTAKACPRAHSLSKKMEGKTTAECAVAFLSLAYDLEREIATRSEKGTKVTPEQHSADRLEGAKVLLKEAQLKTRDVYLQARIHNFLTGEIAPHRQGKA